MKQPEDKKFTIAEILTNFSQRQAQVQQQKMLKEQLKNALMQNQASALGQFVPGMESQMQQPMNPEDMGFDEYYQEAKRGGIKLDPRKKGTFKAQATRMGMSVQQAASHILANKEKYSPAMVKKANFARNFAKEEGGEMMQYEPGGDWPPLKRSAVYVNPAYMNNFTGGVNTTESYFANSPVDIYKQDPAFVIGAQIPLSKRRYPDREGGQGWLMDSYIGMPYSQMIGENAKFLPSAGVNFDYETKPTDNGALSFTRPNANIGLEYNPTDGLSFSGTAGPRIPLTPYGNKRVKPGYAVGHWDIYAGVRGGVGPTGGNPGATVYGSRIEGQYMPKRRSFLNKVLGDDTYIYGKAGFQLDPVKGKMSQEETDDQWIGGDGRTIITQDQEPGTKWGLTGYANVGLKKNLDDIEWKKKKSNAKIKEIEDREKEAEREREEDAAWEEDIKKIKPLIPKKKCPEGQMRYCDSCPCEDIIEKVHHPRWLKEGGMIKRADGSYSQRGLWDNIRANRGSGKEPTKEMLEQERRIKRKYFDGGMTADCDPGFEWSNEYQTCVPIVTENYSKDFLTDWYTRRNQVVNDPNFSTLPQSQQHANWLNKYLPLINERMQTSNVRFEYPDVIDGDPDNRGTYQEETSTEGPVIQISKTGRQNPYEHATTQLHEYTTDSTEGLPEKFGVVQERFVKENIKPYEEILETSVDAERLKTDEDLEETMYNNYMYASGQTPEGKGNVHSYLMNWRKAFNMDPTKVYSEDEISDMVQQAEKSGMLTKGSPNYNDDMYVLYRLAKDNKSLANLFNLMAKNPTPSRTNDDITYAKYGGNFGYMPNFF
jgi:hypothetical protein